MKAPLHCLPLLVFLLTTNFMSAQEESLAQKIRDEYQLNPQNKLTLVNSQADGNYAYALFYQDDGNSANYIITRVDLSSPEKPLRTIYYDTAPFLPEISPSINRALPDSVLRGMLRAYLAREIQLSGGKDALQKQIVTATTQYGLPAPSGLLKEELNQMGITTP